MPANLVRLCAAVGKMKLKKLSDQQIDFDFTNAPKLVKE
jgi:hypothetical protein